MAETSFAVAAAPVASAPDRWKGIGIFITPEELVALRALPTVCSPCQLQQPWSVRESARLCDRYGIGGVAGIHIQTGEFWKPAAEEIHEKRYKSLKP